MSGHFVKRPLLAWMLALMAASTFGEQTPQVLTVDQAVETAVLNNLDLKNASLEVRTQQRMKDHSFNVLFPTISTSATALRLNDASSATVLEAVVPGADNAPMNIYITPDKNNWSLGLKFQEVFTPAIVAQFSQLDVDLENAKISRERAVRGMTGAVRKFFYQLLVLKEAIELTRSRLANSEERLRQSEIAFQLGQQSELTYVQNQVDVDNLRPQLQEQITSYTNNLVIFQDLLGLEPRVDLTLEGNLGDDSVELPPIDLLEAHRLDTKVSAISLQNLESGRNSLVLGALPALVFQYTADPTLNGPTSQNFSNGNNWKQVNGGASLTLAWNLENFLPGSGFWDKRAELTDRIQLAEKRAEQTRAQGIDDLDNRRRSIQTSVAKIADIQKTVTAAHRTLELTEASYRLGNGRLLDLQVAELNDQSAQIQLLNEKLNLKTLLFDLEAQLDTDLSFLQ